MQDNGISTGISAKTITIPTFDGATTSAYLALPAGPGPHPAVVIGAEALGVNIFIRELAEDLARLGYVTIAADYFRGKGPAEPDNYLDFTDVMRAVGLLDFRAATYDQMAAANWLRNQKQVDPARIAVWGYCTGGSLSMLAACLDRNLAAAILFFPSQPYFNAIDAQHPAHPMDMVWNIACPVMIIYGDRDPLMPPERLAELRKRLADWKIENEIKIYKDCSHAFTAETPDLYNPQAAAEATREAKEFLARKLGHVPAEAH
jgi:carboxymethylenebutenolidase